MTGMLWAKMPSNWVRENMLFHSFSTPCNVSEDIAALKLYLVICLLSKEVSRPTLGDQNCKLECRATYDIFTSTCSMSRSLVSKGLRKLCSLGMISVEGGSRSKVYIINQCSDKGWCKLPKRRVFYNEESIPAFAEFFNRYQNERDSLKIYIYLLSSRTNSKNYVDLSRGCISRRTGVPVAKIDGSLGFLQSIGLVEKVVEGNFALKSNEPVSQHRIHRYWVSGHKDFSYRSSVNSGLIEYDLT